MLQTLDVLCSWVQECMIPLSYSVIMLLINYVHHKAGNHTYLWNWAAKSWNQITESTWIRKPSKCDTQPFNSIAYCSLLTRNVVRKM